MKLSFLMNPLTAETFVFEDEYISRAPRVKGMEQLPDFAKEMFAKETAEMLKRILAENN